MLLSISSLSLSAIFLSLTAAADVNIQYADFISKWQDARLGTFKLERTYHSRSIYSGVFGYGWCSILDTHLEKSQSSAGQWVRYECDRRVQHSPPGVTEVFDPTSGRLTRWSAPGVGTLTITYAPSGLLQSAATGEGMKMRFRFDKALEHIVQIDLSSSPLPIKYKYQNQDLVQVLSHSPSTSRSSSTTYTYSPHHNLIATQTADGPRETMTYDEVRDRVLTHTSSQGLQLRLHYQRGSTPLEFKVQAARWAHGLMQTASIYIFRYHALKSGTLVLKSSSVKEVL